jgi:hypothetical protein
MNDGFIHWFFVYVFRTRANTTINPFHYCGHHAQQLRDDATCAVAHYRYVVLYSQTTQI